MDNISLIFIIAQWSIVAVFVIGNLILGLIRGTKKTLYYAGTNLIVLVVSFLIVSFLSVRSFITVKGLISFVEFFRINIPSDIKTYLLDPNLNGIIISVLDLVIKMLAFFLLYPLLRLVFNKLIFNRIWRKMDIKYQIQSMNILEREQHQDEKITSGSRVAGGFFGLLKGFVTAVFFLLPFIVILGAADVTQHQSPSNEPLNENNSANVLSYTTDETSDLDVYLKIIKDANQKGIGRLTQNLRINNKRLDTELFDFLFTLKVNQVDGENIKFKLGSEMNLFGKIASIIIEDGYLDSDFDVNNINLDDNYEGIDLILFNLGSSRLLDIIMPPALEIASKDSNVVNEVGFNLSENIYTKQAINKLKKINWQDETTAISAIIKEVLVIGSIGEIIELTDNPEDILTKDNSEIQKFANVISEVSKLELLNVSHIVLEYLLNQESTLEFVTWTEDPYLYLHEKLDFFFEEEFINKEIGQISKLIYEVFSDEFNDFDYESLFPTDGELDISVYLEERTSPIINALFAEIVEIKTFLHLIPLAVDFSVYQSDDITVEEIADDISGLFNSEEVDFKNEILNINSIYETLITLGVGQLFKEDERVAQLIDEILLTEGNFGHVQTIVNAIFEESQVVSEVLDIAAEPVIERFIEEQETRDVILKVIKKEDFHYGREIITLINLVKKAYQVTDATTILTLIGDEKYLDLIVSVGLFNNDQYQEFKDELFSLQTFTASYEIVELIKNTTGIEEIILPENADQLSIQGDLTKVFDLLYEVSYHVQGQETDFDDLENVNLLNLLPFDKVKEILAFDSTKDENSILLSSLVSYIKNNPVDLGETGIVTIPDDFMNETYNSELWVKELNNIILGTLDLAETYSLNALEFEFTLANFESIVSLDDIPINLITLFSDEDLVDQAFEKLTDSSLIKYNAVEIMRNILVQNEDLPNITIAEDYYKQVDLNQENLLELIKVSMITFNSLVVDNNESLNYNLEKITPTIILTTLNEFDDLFIDRLGYQVTINNIFRNALMDEALHDFVYDTFNQAVQFENLDPIEDGIFVYNVSLDSENKIKEETLASLIHFSRYLNLPNHLFELSPEEQTAVLNNRLNEELVDELFNISLVHELLSNVVKHQNIENLGENYFALMIDQIKEQNINVETTYEPYYESLMYALIANDGLVATHEIKSYLNTYKTAILFEVDLNEVQNGDYNLLTREILAKTYREENLVHYFSNTILMRKLIDTLLHDDSLLESVSQILNDSLVINGEQFMTITKDELKLNNNFFDEEGLLQNHLYDFVMAFVHQDLNIISKQEFTLADIENLIDETENKSNLSYIYDSEIIVEVLEKVTSGDLINEKIIELANEQLANLTRDLGISEYTLSTEDFSLKYEYFDYEAARQMLYTITTLEINELTDLVDINKLADIRRITNIEESRLVFDEFVKIPLLFDLYEVLLTNDKLSKMLAETINVNLILKLNMDLELLDSSHFKLDSSFVNERDLADLFIATLGLNFDFDSDFMSPVFLGELLEDVKVVGVEQNSILHLLSSNVIHYSADKLIQNDQVKIEAAKIVNKTLEDNNIAVSFVSSDFDIPSSALDQNGLINPSEFVVLVESISLLNVDSYSELGNLDTVIKVKDAIPTIVYEKLLESQVAHYSIDKLIQSDKSKEVVIELIAKNFGDLALEISLETLTIPLNLLDDLNRIKTDDLITVIESLYMTNLETFDIQANSPADIEVIFPLAGLEHLLSSELIKYSITNLTQAGQMRSLLAEFINKELAKQNIDGEFTASNFLIPDHILDSKGYINNDDILIMTETFYNLGIESFNNIPLNNPKAIETILNVSQFANLINESPLSYYILDKAIQNSQVRSLLATTINDYANKTGVDLVLSPEQLVIPKEALVNGQITQFDFINMLSVFYDLGIDDFAVITLNGPKDFENIMGLPLFDRLLETDAFYHVTSKVMMSKALQDALASTGNKYISDFGVSRLLKPDYFLIPENALIDDMVSKAELAKLLEIFYALNVENFNELGQINTIGKIKDLIYAEYFDLMLESELIYYAMGYITQTETFRSDLAVETAKYLKNSFDVDVDLQAVDFLFDQHDVLIANGNYKDYIRKEELTQFYNSFLIFNEEVITGKPFGFLIKDITDELLRNQGLGYLIIDEMLESNMILTIFDRAINLDANERLELGALDFMNKKLASTKFGHITLNSDDQIFDYHDSVYTAEGYISKKSIKDVVLSLNIMDLTDEINVKVMTNLIDKNIDGTGQDDFDRFYESMLLQSLISNVALNDRFVTISADELNERQGRIKFTLELLRIPGEVVHEGIIFDYEVKHLFRNLIILDIYEFDMADLTVKLITDLLGKNDDGTQDDLDRLLESYITFNYIDRTMKAELLEPTFASEASKHLKEDIQKVNISLTADMLDEDGKFSKEEIRKILVSLKLLNVQYFSDLSDLTLLDILLLDNEDDDLDVFLDSNYIRVMIGRAVQSNTLRTRFANSANFAVEDFDLLAANKDDYGNLSKEEVKNLLRGLNTLIITDFNNISISNVTLKGLTNDELDIVLSSTYLYQIIDLKLKVELKENVKVESLVGDGTNFNDYIKKTEIKGLIAALSILDVNNTDDIKADVITINQLEELIEIDSYILRNLISDVIDKQIDVPDNSKDHHGVLTQKELRHLIVAMEILLGDRNTNIGSFKMSEIEVTVVQLDNLLAIGTDVDPENGSPLITRLLSEEVIEIFGDSLDPRAYSSDKDLKRTELNYIKDALYELEIIVITDNLDLENLAVTNIYNIHEYNSIILNKLISDEIIKAVDENDIPEEAIEEETGQITYEEQGRVLRALIIINVPITDLTTLKTNNISLTTVEVARQEESLIIDRYISNGLINEENIVTDNVLDAEGNVERDEVTKFIAAINSLPGVDTVDDFVTYLRESATIADLYLLVATDSQILKDTAQRKIEEIIFG